MESHLTASSPPRLSNRAIALGIVVFTIVALAAIWFVAPWPGPPDLDVSGWWRLELAISAAAGDDIAVFNLQL